MRPGSTPASMLKKPGSKSRTEQSSKESKQAATRKEAERLLQEEREAQARRAMTMDQIKSTSKSNKHIIFKFVKKGFAALSAEELACTMVNPAFSIDFKENTGDDWNIQYQSMVVEKLQRCKFHMHWFIKSATTSPGYDDAHEQFMKHVESGNMDQVFMYLRKNDASNVLQAVEQKSKRSPLHIAAKFGYHHLIKFFLDREANIEARDKLLKTPLHYACEFGHTLVVKELLERGADPMDKDNCGRTSLHYAVCSGQTDIVTRLTQQSTDIVHITDHGGRTPLHHAVFMEANQVRLIS